ncbi:hypothetical protein TNIN_157781 [Trichonephila inaurata madagascariensis]|uniref:Uncharacterized protein n=1 Tax=Trichonephila inaurata madagascariensis TaxID=2747483 RepID=A0A8X6YVC5_9ARAC|nr:hypothetical protein TNIN_157781 [Trichonephila inaurata madagascariensis]
MWGESPLGEYLCDIVNRLIDDSPSGLPLIIAKEPGLLSINYLEKNVFRSRGGKEHFFFEKDPFRNDDPIHFTSWDISVKKTISSPLLHREKEKSFRIITLIVRRGCLQ